MRGEIADRADIHRLALFPIHCQGIGVLEAERAQHPDAVGRCEPLRKLGQQLVALRRILALHAIDPKRAGVVDRDVDVTGRERVEQNVGAKPGPPLGGEAGGFKTLLDQRCQNILFGERLGADGILGA